jgi:hypothetical protein
MWHRISQPDILIFLDVSLPAIEERKPRSDWTQSILDEQCLRLAHARTHCDLYIATDGVDEAEVVRQVAAYLSQLPEAVPGGEAKR